MNKCTEAGLEQCKACIVKSELCIFWWYHIQLNKVHNEKDSKNGLLELITFVKRSFPHEMIYFMEAVKSYPNFEKILILL